MARVAPYQGSVSSDVVAGGTEILALDGEFDLSNAPSSSGGCPKRPNPSRQTSWSTSAVSSSLAQRCCTRWFAG